MCVVSRYSYDFVGETVVVNILNGGKSVSCSHYVLEALAAGDGASTVPHSDAAAQDALYSLLLISPTLLYSCFYSTWFEKCFHCSFVSMDTHNILYDVTSLALLCLFWTRAKAGTKNWPR